MIVRKLKETGEKIIVKVKVSCYEEGIGKKEIVGYFFKVLALLVGATLSFHLSVIGNNMNNTLITGNTDSEILELQESDNNSIIKDSTIVKDEHVEFNNYFSKLIDENTSADTMLRYAEYAYASGMYEEAIKIYSMDKVSNNKITLNNLGFFYANGIYFNANVEMADYYYDAAIALGSTKALDNKLAMHLKNKMSDTIELFKKAHEKKDINAVTLLLFYIKKYYKDFDESNYLEVLEQFLFDTNEEEQNRVISNTYSWKKGKIVYLSMSPKNTEIEKYILVSEQSWIDSDKGIAGTTKVYQRYDLICEGIGVLEEGIEKVF